ncbi:hypothetical protein J699_03834 [Acinetobacter sp. 1000160]|nr:hypothetical protein J522_1268 [Acinetobacter baumannii 146457]EYT13825.1 hypothetical protein J699_03834 [Acinetobacter sp. 1000160]
MISLFKFLHTIQNHYAFAVLLVTPTTFIHCAKIVQNK